MSESSLKKPIGEYCYDAKCVLYTSRRVSVVRKVTNTGAGRKEVRSDSSVSFSDLR